MSAEIDLRFFLEQFRIERQVGHLFVEVRDGESRLYDWRGSMKLYDPAALRERYGTLDDKKLQNILIQSPDLPTHTVFGAAGTSEAINRPVASYAKHHEMARTDADFLARMVSHCFVGFEQMRYSEEGILCSHADFEMQPHRFEEVLKTLASVGAVKYRHHEINHNKLHLFLRRDLVDYREDIAPLFLSALTFRS